MSYRKMRSKSLVLVSALCAVVLLTMVQPSAAAYIVDPSAYWKLDEADPSTEDVTDEVASIVGTCTACPVTDSPGQVGDAFFFDGTQSVVFEGTGADVFDFANGASFTIELWMKRLNASTGNAAFIGRPGASPSPAWYLGFNASGQATMALWDDSGSPAFSATGTTVLTGGEWHHIAMVRDGASGSNMKLYVDGVLEAEGGNDRTNGHFISDQDVTLGGQGAALPYRGQLDNLAVYEP